MLEQTNPQNTDQKLVKFRCRGCQATPEIGDVIEAVVEQELGVEAYLRVKDAGEDGPIYDCPACDSHCYIEEEGACANCGEGLDYDATCYRCGGKISVQDCLDVFDSGLCSYCTNLYEKAMRE